jgi:hypothetical protein
MSIQRRKNDYVEKVIEQARRFLEKLLLLQREDPREFEQAFGDGFQRELPFSFNDIRSWTNDEFLQQVSAHYTDPVTLELLADVIKLKADAEEKEPARALYAKSLVLYDHIYRHAGTLSFTLLDKKTAVERLLNS